MNILIINHYAGTPEMGMEFRPYYFAREWIKMGHRVDIIASDYSHLRRINPKVDNDFQEDMIDGIHYHWIKTGTYEGNGVKRALTMAKFVLKLWMNAGKIIKEMNPDAVICSSTYPLDTYAGQKIKKKSKKKLKLIHEVHDMWPATLIEIGGMSRKHPFVMAMQFAENSAYKNSDCVFALLEYTKEYMVKHGLKEDRWHWIPLGIDLDQWNVEHRLTEKHENTLMQLKHEGKFIVGYFGGHAMSNALGTLIDCAEKESDSDVHFVLVGNGVEKKLLQKRVEEENIRNVTFLPPIDKNEIPKLLEHFDCIYIGLHKSPLYRFGLCINKMIDAMMSGKPIICAITAPETWVEKSGCGINVGSDNITGLIDAIEETKKMSVETRIEMKNNGIKFVENYLDIKKLAKKAMRIIEKIN
ncbi:MAG: glycosyltransferase family 4 protein [Anaerovoracaceae bacterium]